MKTPTKKLTLKKESLKRLDDTQMRAANGGATINDCTSRPTIGTRLDIYEYNLDYQLLDYNLYKI